MVMGARADQLAFVVCCMINLLDVMGMTFTGPVLLPYGRILGATTAQIASFQTTRYAVGFASMAWMPPFADRRGIKLCLLISIVGSGVAYAIQGSAHHFGGCGVVPHTMPPDGQAMLISGVKPGSCALVHGVGDLTATYFAHNSSAAVAWSGGVLECEEDCGTQAGVVAMLVGRAVSGFFAGTQPVMRSFVTKLSLPDEAALKFRITMLFASQQAAGLALAPVAGFLGRWGMHLPWHVSAAFAVVVLACFARFFDNPEKIRERQTQALKDEAAAAAPSPEEGGEVPPWEGPPPGCDKILYIMLVAYVILFSVASSLLILLPLLLEYPAYGLVDPDSETRTQENLARGTALVGLPHGVMNVLCGTVVFIRVSSCIGDRNTLRVGAAIGATCLCLYGYGTSRFWHLLCLHGVLGVGIGLLVPAVGPTLQRYSNAAHPAKLSQASAVPMFGLTIGMGLGPLVYSAILGEGQDRARMDLAWLVAAALFTVSWGLMEVAFTLIGRHPAMQRPGALSREVGDGGRAGASSDDGSSTSASSDGACSDSD